MTHKARLGSFELYDSASLETKFFFFVGSTGPVALVGGFHSFREHGPPHLQLLIIFKHHVLGV